eukprot:10118388-Alexandrium_andersonii.AAC.1
MGEISPTTQGTKTAGPRITRQATKRRKGPAGTASTHEHCPAAAMRFEQANEHGEPWANHSKNRPKPVGHVNTCRGACHPVHSLPRRRPEPQTRDGRQEKAQSRRDRPAPSGNEG